jgi:hypothetical protein
LYTKEKTQGTKKEGPIKKEIMENRNEDGESLTKPEAKTGECSIKPMIRYTSAPTKYDKAPYGTFCSVLLNDEGTIKELYVQASRNEDDPQWISAEQLLVAALKDKLTDICFLQDCLQTITTIPS